MEVALATALFGTALILLTSAFANALTAMNAMRREAGDEPMFGFLRSKIITVPDIDNFEEGEELYLPDGDSANWTAEVAPTGVADLFRVRLMMEIERRDDRDKVSRTETLYLLRPTWSESVERADIIEEAARALETSRRELR
jgi:hypothetical protein